MPLKIAQITCNSKGLNQIGSICASITDTSRNCVGGGKVLLVVTKSGQQPRQFTGKIALGGRSRGGSKPSSWWPTLTLTFRSDKESGTLWLRRRPLRNFCLIHCYSIF